MEITYSGDGRGLALTTMVRSPMTHATDRSTRSRHDHTRAKFRQAITCLTMVLVFCSATSVAWAGVITTVPYANYIAPTTPGDPRTFHMIAHNADPLQTRRATAYAFNDHWFLGTTHFANNYFAPGSLGIQAASADNFVTGSPSWVNVTQVIPLSGYTSVNGVGRDIALFYTPDSLGFTQATIFTGQINTSMIFEGSGTGKVVVNGSVVDPWPGDRMTGEMKMSLSGLQAGLDPNYWIQNNQLQPGLQFPMGLADGDSGTVLTFPSGPFQDQLALMGTFKVGNFEFTGYGELGPSALEIYAITAVPEPSSFLLVAMGGLVCPAVRSFRNRRM